MQNVTENLAEESAPGEEVPARFDQLDLQLAVVVPRPGDRAAEVLQLAAEAYQPLPFRRATRRAVGALRQSQVPLCMSLQPAVGRGPSRSRICAGVRTRVRAAASSTASGRSSSRWQSTAIVSSGSSRERSQKRSTASGSASGGTG